MKQTHKKKQEAPKQVPGHALAEAVTPMHVASERYTPEEKP